jgi:hypothetical protein
VLHRPFEPGDLAANHQVESNLPGRSTGGISRTAGKLSARAVAAGRRAS